MFANKLRFYPNEYLLYIQSFRIAISHVTCVNLSHDKDDLLTSEHKI